MGFKFFPANEINRFIAVMVVGAVGLFVTAVAARTYSNRVLTPDELTLFIEQSQTPACIAQGALKLSNLGLEINRKALRQLQSQCDPQRQRKVL